MNISRSIAISLIALSLSACAQTRTSASDPTRLDLTPLGFASTSLQSDSLAEQAQALDAQAARIVHASALRGAAVGAAIGCGLGVMSSSGAAQCLGGAAIGAVGGAAIGRKSGQRAVARRVALVSPNALVTNLRKADDTLSELSQDLPAVLAAQDAELTELALAFAANRISADTHDKRINRIKQDRAALAQSLDLTAAQARKATRNLQAAQAAGQTGLDWHIRASENLARQTTSARSSISLL